MKTTTLRSLALLLGLIPLSVHAVTPPVNDKFANAIAFNGRHVTYLNQNGSNATAETLDPYIGGVKLTHSVWYRFDALFTVDTCHVILNHSTVPARIGVYALTDVDGGEGSLAELAQASNASPGTDTLTFQSYAGQRYYVCVEVLGSFGITLQQPGQHNDLLADATVLAGTQGSIVGNTLNCTDQGDTPLNPGSISPSNGVWYTWAPGITAQVAVDTNFSYTYGTVAHNTKIAVFTSATTPATLASLTYVTGDADSGNNGNSRVSFAAAAGTTYYLWVGDANATGNSGAFHLEWFLETSPGIFNITAPVTSVGSNQGFLPVSVERHFAGSVAPNVTIATDTSGFSAVAGTDFIAFSQVLHFPSGASGSGNAFLQEVSLTLLPHTAPESTKNLGLKISSPTLSATLDTAELFLNITSEPYPVAPGFTVQAMTVQKNAGVLSIPVIRGSATGTAIVDVAPDIGGTDTAQVGVDYSLNTIAVELQPGQATGFVQVTILGNGLSKGTEIFTLNLSPGDPTLPIDGSPTITITILDNKPPLPAAGRLAAVLDDVSSDIAGSLNMTVSATGAITGKLIMDKGALPFTGKLDATGLLVVRFGPAGAPTRTLTIQLLNPASGTYQVTLQDNVLGSQVTTTLSTTNFSALSPCPAAGSYTVTDTQVIPPLPPLAMGALKVDALGNATLTGKVFDGTAFIATGSVDALNSVAVGVSLYAGQGRLTLTNAIISSALPTVPQTPAPAAVRLVRPGRAGLPAGKELPPVDTYHYAEIAIYTPPAGGSRPLTVWDQAGPTLGQGNADLSTGGYASLTVQGLNISSTSSVTLRGVSNIPTLKLTLTPATGIFTGTLTPPPIAPATVGKSTAIFGVLLQAGPSSTGQGFFVNGVTPGYIELLGP